MKTKFRNGLPVIAAAGGVATFVFYCGSYYYLKRKYEGAPFAQHAMKLLEAYPPAVNYFGTPIKVESVFFFGELSRFHNTNPEATRLKLNVGGPKGSGHLYIWARCSPISDDRFQIQRLDVEVNSQRKRWKFYETEPVHDKYTEEFDALKTDNKS